MHRISEAISNLSPTGIMASGVGAVAGSQAKVDFLDYPILDLGAFIVTPGTLGFFLGLGLTVYGFYRSRK